MGVMVRIFQMFIFFLEVTSHDISFLAGESLDFCIEYIIFFLAEEVFVFFS